MKETDIFPDHSQRLLTQPNAGYVQILTLSACFALATAHGELLVFAARKFVFHHMLFVGPQAVYMTPLSYGFFFAPVGVALCIAARFWPRLVSMPITVFCLTLLAASSFFFLFHPKLHIVAILALALGIAMQMARFAKANPNAFSNVVRRSAATMAALTLIVAVGMHTWWWAGERLERRSLPQAPSGKPNVLLVVLDTVRASSLSVHGYSRATTPRLAQLAEKGVIFNRAMTPAPWTTPTHASMFTGRWPHELVRQWSTTRVNQLNSNYPTLAESLSAKGYLTAGFVANMKYCGHETGLQRGFLVYEDYPTSFAGLITSSSPGRLISSSPKLRRLVGYYDILGRKDAKQINSDFLQWFDQQERRPFFVFLNFFDAHQPYLPPEPFNDMFGSVAGRNHFLPDLWRNNQAQGMTVNAKQEEVQADLDAYESSIAYLDDQLGQLFEQLNARGVLENTLVIITSDHGEQFGEHGLFEHVNSLYLPLLHVPLILVHQAELPSGISISKPVSVQQLPATIVDLLDLEEEARFPGTSLARYWESTQSLSDLRTQPLLSEVNMIPRVLGPASQGDMKSLVYERYHYIRNGDLSEELYDFENDPRELQDLGRSSDHQQLLVWFRKSLDKMTNRTR